MSKSNHTPKYGAYAGAAARQAYAKIDFGDFAHHGPISVIMRGINVDVRDAINGAW